MSIYSKAVWIVTTTESMNASDPMGGPRGDEGHCQDARRSAARFSTFVRATKPAS